MRHLKPWPKIKSPLKMHSIMIIHAVSIHSGGGKILLDQLLTEKTFGKVAILLCDTRYTPPAEIGPSLEIIKIKPTLFERWMAEKKLKELTDGNPGQSVLCFSNLPPAFKLNANVILYLQNALLLPNAPFYVNSLKTALRIIYEKIWLYIFWKNLNTVWVQTNWMQEELGKQKIPIVVKPIIPIFSQIENNNASKVYDFVSVSGSVSHKRLANLLKAWALMPDPAPSLLVITDKKESYFANLEKKNVIFKINVSRDEVLRSYAESKCLILTSRLESFCLPIYEAIHFGLKLIVPDEKYAKEACIADLVIDPENPKDMQRLIIEFKKRL